MSSLREQIQDGVVTIDYGGDPAEVVFLHDIPLDRIDEMEAENEQLQKRIDYDRSIIDYERKAKERLQAENERLQKRLDEIPFQDIVSLVATVDAMQPVVDAAVAWADAVGEDALSNAIRNLDVAVRAYRAGDKPDCCPDCGGGKERPCECPTYKYNVPPGKPEVDPSAPQHRWSGWPGAWCLDCGCSDPYEASGCDDDADLSVYAGSKPCPYPNEGRFDPYKSRTREENKPEMWQEQPCVWEGHEKDHHEFYTDLKGGYYCRRCGKRSKPEVDADRAEDKREVDEYERGVREEQQRKECAFMHGDWTDVERKIIVEYGDERSKKGYERGVRDAAEWLADRGFLNVHVLLRVLLPIQPPTEDE